MAKIGMEHWPAGLPLALGTAALVVAAFGPGSPEVVAQRAEARTGGPGMRAMLDRFRVDRDSLDEFFSSRLSAGDVARRRAFLEGWQERLAAVEPDKLRVPGAIDYVLFDNQLRRELRQLDDGWRRVEAIEEFLPFRAPLVGLFERRRAVDKLPGREAAEVLAGIEEQVGAARALWPSAAGEEIPEPRRVLANRTRNAVLELQRTLGRWGEFYRGYDPVVSWWTERPLESASEALEGYAAFLRADVLGAAENEDDPVVGDPTGRELLLEELKAEFIAYTPEELVEIAEREFEWCERERLEASRELGFGDDWRAALDHVKNSYVEPGEQTYLIRELAHEAVGYLKERDLLTIPRLCEETWEMRMMSPERQKVNPYFTGGQTISVSFPTSGMAHPDKLMSLRGNNRHFARATVHHELIPGHHLQLFMADRYRPYRQVFRTPFFVEGWALYWELLLWDMGFAQGPEDEIGMLFWRSHRCARIIFSLKFHLGEMSASEAIEFLVERVGHERSNATGEVRRSVAGDYEPLYQAAYLLGGLQLMSLRRELVDSGQMGEKEFHDAVLRENSIPVELVRASLTGVPPVPGAGSTWRWYGE